MSEIERLREDALVKWLRRMGTGGHPDQINPDQRYNQAADCIILLRAALSSTPPVAERGEWQTVPVEPTREMWAAAGDAVVNLVARNIAFHDKLSEAVWGAMLKAAPPSSRETEGQE